jgi:hypothetical protein
MSVGYKEAAKAMFSEGNSPLFPGMFMTLKQIYPEHCC